MRSFHYFIVIFLIFAVTKASEDKYKEKYFSNLQVFFLSKIKELEKDRSQETQELVFWMHENLYQLAHRDYLNQQLDALKIAKKNLIQCMLQGSDLEKRKINLNVLSTLSTIEIFLQKNTLDIESEISKPFNNTQ